MAQRFGALVILVGSESHSREIVATDLIDRGYSVVMCPGPPPCPFLRGERCEISPAADVVVFLRTTAPSGETVTGLRACGQAAKRVVVAGRGARHPAFQADAFADSVGPEQVAGAIESVLSRLRFKS